MKMRSQHCDLKRHCETIWQILFLEQKQNFSKKEYYNSGPNKNKSFCPGATAIQNDKNMIYFSLFGYIIDKMKSNNTKNKTNKKDQRNRKMFKSKKS